MLIPEVVGFKLTGQLREGATATDLVLTVTEMLRKKGVVGKFVEFFGPGLSSLPLPDRATIANMAPEYGATAGYFPVDAETLAYLRFTGRDEAQVAAGRGLLQGAGPLPHRRHAGARVHRHARARPAATSCRASPGRGGPQDRVALTDAKQSWRMNLAPLLGAGAHIDPARLERWLNEGGSAAQPADARRYRRPGARPVQVRRRRRTTASSSATAPWSSPRSRAAPTPRTRRC